MPTPDLEVKPLPLDLATSNTQKWDPKAFTKGPGDSGTVPARWPQPVDGTFLPGEVDVMPRIEPGARCSGEFPLALRSAGFSGSVLVQFVVDTLGTVVPSSVRVVRSSNPALESPAISGLTGTRCRYIPAQSRGKLVAVLVQQSIRFTLK